MKFPMFALFCECTMAAIEDFCGGGNVAGLTRRLYATCEDQIASIAAPTADTHTVPTITMRASAVGPPAVTAGKFFTWHFSQKDQDFKSSRNEESGAWETEVKIFVPKLEDSKSFMLNGIDGENNIFIVEDNNNKKRLVGELNNGATVLPVEQATPKNGYVITIKWTSAHSPYFYGGSVTV
jgi:hypothetical protein